MVYPALSPMTKPDHQFILFVPSLTEKNQQLIQDHIAGAKVLFHNYPTPGVLCVVQKKLVLQEQLQRQDTQHLQVVQKLMLRIKMKEVLETEPKPGYEPLTRLQVKLLSLHEKHLPEPPQFLLDLSDFGNITPAEATKSFHAVFNGMQTVLKRRNPIQMLDDSGSNLAFATSGDEMLAWIKDQVDSCVASQVPEHRLLLPNNDQSPLMWEDLWDRVNDRRNSGLLQMQLSLFDQWDDLEDQNGGRPLGVSAAELYQKVLTVDLNAMETEAMAGAWTAKALMPLLGGSFDLGLNIGHDFVVNRRSYWRDSKTDRAELLEALPPPPAKEEVRAQAEMALTPDDDKSHDLDLSDDEDDAMGPALLLLTQHGEKSDGVVTPSTVGAEPTAEANGSEIYGGNVDGSVADEGISQDRKRKADDLSAENKRLKKEIESLKAKARLTVPVAKKKRKARKEVPTEAFNKLWGILSSSKYGWVHRTAKSKDGGEGRSKQKFWYAPSSFKERAKGHVTKRLVVDRVLSHESFQGDEELLKAAKACIVGADSPKELIVHPTTTSVETSAPAVSSTGSSNIEGAKISASDRSLKATEPRPNTGTNDASPETADI